MVDYMVPGNAEEHRVHDSLCYHGAGTGRWAGRGVQPQNFPRAQSKQPDEDIQKFVNHEVMDDPIGVSKSLLRSVIKAPEGYRLIVSDYSSIENRVLAWVAGDTETLDGFANGFDQYVDMAASKYGRSYEDLKAGCDAEDPESSAQRQMGKVIVLGCGYGMGATTFQKSAKNFGIFLTEDEAQEAVGAYREKYYKVVQCWNGLKRAAIKAVISGDRVAYGPIVFGKAVVNGIPWLAMRLPSGKSIYYCKPFIEDRHVPGYEHRSKVPTLMHMGVNPLNRKWTKVPLIPGRITENAVQGLSREIMGRGMLNLLENMPDVTLIGTVHDEALGLVSEEALGYNEFMREEHECSSYLEEFNHQLCDVSFVPGLPIEAKGYISKRYKK
jgi:DNA polymerase